MGTRGFWRPAPTGRGDYVGALLQVFSQMRKRARCASHGKRRPRDINSSRVPALDQGRRDRGQDELAQEEDQQQKDDGRNVDAAEVGQKAPDRPQRGFGDPVQEIADRADELVARIDDVEGVEPGEDRRQDDQPPVDVQRQDDGLNEGDHAGLHWSRSAATDALSLVADM